MREDVGFLLTDLAFLVDFSIKVLEVSFSESIVLEEASNFVVNVLANLRLVSVLQLELVDEHTLELLALLDIHELFLTCFSHTSGS